MQNQGKVYSMHQSWDFKFAMFPITCPHCGNTLPIENILQDKKTGKARGRCSQCKKWIQILLPSIRKKLIYLDQSFLSAACLEADKPTSQNEVRILSKLTELKARQRIFVVVSDVHSRETSAIPDEHTGNRKKLWQFQNELADGSISCDYDEVFVAQWQRMLADQDNSNFFPASDIGLDDPHLFQIGVRVQLTNHWRPKLHRDNARPRDTINEEFRSIIERQLENMPSCKDVRDCLNYIRGLYRKDIRQGIASWRKQRDLRLLMEQIVKELEAGRIPVMPQWEAPAPYQRVVGEVVQGMKEEIALQQWLKFLEGDSANLCAYDRVRSAFEAALLWKFRTHGATDNLERFNKKFGQSCQNDIGHISTFAPYVDVLTTDKKMHNVCKDRVVADELNQFPCKIFSKNNYDEFEAWLDALLAESVTHNVRVQSPTAWHQ